MINCCILCVSCSPYEISFSCPENQIYFLKNICGGFFFMVFKYNFGCDYASLFEAIIEFECVDSFK